MLKDVNIIRLFSFFAIFLLPLGGIVLAKQTDSIAFITYARTSSLSLTPSKNVSSLNSQRLESNTSTTVIVPVISGTSNRGTTSSRIIDQDNGIIVSPVVEKGINPQPEPPISDDSTNERMEVKDTLKNIRQTVELNPQPEPPINDDSTNERMEIKDTLKNIRQIVQLNPQPEPPIPVTLDELSNWTNRFV